MKYPIILLTVLLFEVSCKSESDSQKRILDKINEINSHYSMYVYSQFEDFRDDRVNQMHLEFAKKIRSSRDTLNHYIENDISSDDFVDLLKKYRQTLIEVCDSIGFYDSLTFDLFRDKKKQLNKDPLDYLTQLSLSEMDILTYLIARTGGHYGFFSYEFQFDKAQYTIGDTVKFVAYPLNTGHEIKINYDSVEFYNMNPDINRNIDVDYQLSQEIRTGIVEFKTKHPGRYWISVYSTFESDVLKKNQAIFTDMVLINDLD